MLEFYSAFKELCDAEVHAALDAVRKRSYHKGYNLNSPPSAGGARAGIDILGTV